MTKKKVQLINYIIGNQTSSRRNKIYSITLELKHVINHFDVRRRVYATSLSAKEKRSFVKNSQDIKLIWPRDSSNDIITTEQSNRLQKLYIYKNYSYNAHLFICDNSLQAKLDYPKCNTRNFNYRKENLVLPISLILGPYH